MKIIETETKIDKNKKKLENILNTTKKLISIKTNPENFKELEKALEIVKSILKEYTIEEFSYKNYKSLLIHNQKKGHRKFKLILNGHLDVIPSNAKKYETKIIGNKLYGIGSMDMKANLTSMIYAFKDFAKTISEPIAVQIVTDEEIGGFYGTKYQIEQGVQSEFVICTEATNFNIVNKAKGIIWAKISVRGISAHGAYPWLGKNALIEAYKIIKKILKKYPIPKTKQKNIWITSVNLAKIETNNNSFNKIPSEATIWLDIRYIPEDKEKVINEIKNILRKEQKLEILVNEPFLNVNEKNKYIQKILEITKKITNQEPTTYGAMGSSDARHYTQINSSAIEFGPIGGNIGSEEEWVDINSLENFYLICSKLITELPNV